MLSAGGYGTISDIADAIRFAADNGANVLSLSLGGGGRSRIMESAVDHARARGCIVVCAAGSLPGDLLYPAKLASQRVRLGLTTDPAAKVNGGRTVDPDVPGALVTSPVTGEGSFLMIQTDGTAVELVDQRCE